MSLTQLRGLITQTHHQLAATPVASPAFTSLASQLQQYRGHLRGVEDVLRQAK